MRERVNQSPPLAAVLIAVAGGYLAGSAPMAWLVVRRRHGLDLRHHGVGGTGALDALFIAGPRAALTAAILEFLKGAVVGIAARAYSDTGWFTATAIAACVTGDAFPIGFRRGGRGLVPLISGLLFALPLAGILTGLVAIPAATLTRMGGRVYATVVVVAVPLGIVLGTAQLVSLVPAGVIVIVLLLARRRGPRGRALISPPRVTVIDTGRNQPPGEGPIGHHPRS